MKTLTNSLMATLAKAASFGLLAAAVAVAVPTKAAAQVSFGVRVGPPLGYGYYAPRPVYPPVVYGRGYAGYPLYGQGYADRRDWNRERWERRDDNRGYDHREYDHRDDHHDDNRGWR